VPRYLVKPTFPDRLLDAHSVETAGSPPPLQKGWIRIVSVLAGVCAAVVLPATAPAAGALRFADADTHASVGGFSLKLSAPPRVVVGQPTVVQVSGTIPVDSTRFPYWLSVVSISPKVMSSCPANPWDAEQVANATGGSVLVLTSREVPDAYGNFTAPVGINPYAPGRVMICAYSDDGGMVTLAAGSLMLSIAPKVSAARPPASIWPPRVTRTPRFLSCSSGSWSSRPTLYAWLAGGRQVGRGQRLEISAALRGRTVRCRVTAPNDAGTQSALSRQVLVR